MKRELFNKQQRRKFEEEEEGKARRDTDYRAPLPTFTGKATRTAQGKPVPAKSPKL